MVESLLVAEDIWKEFPTRRGERLTALRQINLRVDENEFVTLVGPSGCGKSTLLMIAAGLDYASRGTIWINQKRVVGPGMERGMVFQSYTLFPWLDVFENIRFALKKRGLSRQEENLLVEEQIALIGLQGFESAYPAQLSGGMRQRVAIARALVYQPQILLMDEPFGALDAQTRMQMQDLLLQVWETRRTTVLFVTHDVDEAILLSDRVVVMTPRPGRVKTEILIDIPRPRRTEVELTGRFIELRRQLLDLIRHQETDAPPAVSAQQA